MPHLPDPPKHSHALGMLFLTRRCNLDCGYCHMVHKGIDDMPQERLKRALHLLFESHDNLLLHFFGGEPLLRMDLLQWAVDYIEQTWPDHPSVDYLITTNGVLLRDKFLDYLIEKDFRLMLSFDGTYESQQDWRVALGDNERAYHEVVEALDRIKARGVPFFVNMVVSPNNVHRMEENLLHLVELGATTVQLSYELGALWTPDARAVYLRNLRHLIRTHHRNGVNIQNSPFSEPVLGNPFFVFDVNGDMFHGCAVVLETSMPTFNDTARIGHIDDYTTLKGVQRNRIEQVTHFLRGTKPNAHDYELLRSNMHIGYQVRHLLTSMGHEP